ncbi:MAG: divalent metal cation transporter [Patescibacteria group bacterium]
MSRFKKFLRILGPGFITGASDDDPSGIGTYSQAGAQFGFSTLWVALFTFPFMTVVQEMCGRIGMVTGKGLAAVMRIHYPKWILYSCVFLLVLANTVNIGADLGAMASAAEMVTGLPFVWCLILLTAIVLGLVIFLTYSTYAKVLKWLTLALFAYVAVVFAVKVDWAVVLTHTFVPHITWSKEFVMMLVALLGTTISPYLFFWQADEEVEEAIAQHKLLPGAQRAPRVTENDITSMRWDTVIGMFFSNIVMFFIIVATAVTLNANGITQIETADQAARALAPIAGELATLLFAIGIIGTGLLAVPVLAGSASYAVSETFGWHTGLARTWRQAEGFYGVIVLATLVGLLVNFVGIPPFKMLYYTAIFNGMAAPILLVVILLISSNRKIMKSHTNSLFSNVLGWVICLFMGASAIALLYLL